MREIFYSILIFCLIITIFSCGKTTEENVNDVVSKTNENIDGVIEDNNDTVATGGSYGDSDFQINPEEGASVWEVETTDNGYALVGLKDRRPWVQIVDKNGSYQLSKRYEVFGEYKSNFDDWDRQQLRQCIPHPLFVKLHSQ